MKLPRFQKKDLLPFLIYLYLFLPFALFLIGWTKPLVSIPLLIVLAVCFYRMVRSFPELWIPKISRDDFFKIAFILFVIFVWVYFSGIGRFVYQNSDHRYRNGIFEILVAEKWPVINFSPPIEKYEEPVALVYYFGFWLPAAVTGKIFGLTAGYFAQVFWAAAGIFLFYYLIIAKYIQKIVFWPLLVLIFFSGLDILGMYLLGNKISDVANTAHIEFWARLFQFSSMTTQLFWVFNQAVPAWLATLVLLYQKDNRYIAVIIALTMITSTLPFVGLAVLAIFAAVRNFFSNKIGNDKQVVVFLRDTFTFENIVGGGGVALISFLFLTANIAGNEIRFLDFQAKKGTVFLWFLFYAVEAGIYFIAVWKYQKNNYLLYYCALWLAVCPWIDLGYYHDFSMRTSIPALVIVMLLVIDTINKSRCVRDLKTLIAISVIIAIGSFSTPIREITRTATNTVQLMRENQPVARESREPWRLDVYCGYLKDNIFFDYLARVPKEK